MNIAVCIKYVPDPTTVEIDPISGKIDHQRILHITNPADECALEYALRLRNTGGRIRALCVGPKNAESVLRNALAIGVDEAIRLWDDNWDQTSPELTAWILNTALRDENLPDLVLCGNRSSDNNTGIVPTMLAELLDLPIVTDVTNLEASDGSIQVLRRLSRGAREKVKVDLPAVLSLTPEIVELRHASLPGLIHAEKVEIASLQPRDFISPVSQPQVQQPITRDIRLQRRRARPIFTPDSNLPPHERIAQILSGGMKRKSGHKIELEPYQAAIAIIDFLREHGFLEK